MAATNLRNGLFVATQNGGSDKDAASAPQQRMEKPQYPLGPDAHNDKVMEYFISAGIPRDQVGGIHANTYLSGGGVGEFGAAARKIEGYASVLERVVGDKVPVAESMRGRVSTLKGSRSLSGSTGPQFRRRRSQTRGDSTSRCRVRKEAYRGHLPAGLSNGTVVIHHSSAAEEGPFEALATYDVVDNLGNAPAESEKASKAPGGGAVVRHFDADGVERRLSSERFNMGPSDAGAKN